MNITRHTRWFRSPFLINLRGYTQGGIAVVASLALGACGFSSKSDQKLAAEQRRASLIPAKSHINSHPLLTTIQPIIPFYFEENRGQVADEVKYLARGHGYTVFLTPTETVLALQQVGAGPERSSACQSLDERHLAPQQEMTRCDRQQESQVSQPPLALRLQLTAANRQPQLRAEEPLAGRVNYFIGNDLRQWRTAIPTFSKVRYRDVYPGIDVVYYGQQRQVEYDFIVQPGADPGQIRMRFTGAEDLKLDAGGDVILFVPGGELRMRKPRAYQEIAGQQRLVQSEYRLLAAADGEVKDIGLTLAVFDTAQPLTIDPVLSYSTYLGGGPEPPLGGDDGAFGVTVDGNDFAYVVGATNSPTFPTGSSSSLQVFQETFAGYNDAFIAKLTPDGSALVYATYLGGSEFEQALGVAADRSGSAYITGRTRSADFPVVNAVQSTIKGVGQVYRDAFVTKLTPNGTALVFSTYLGGSLEDIANAIAVDSDGHAFVSGSTGSPDFPMVRALQSPGGSVDAFVAKLSRDGAALVYATYLGGSAGDGASGIAVDSSGATYVAGTTDSTDFPVVHALQPTYAGGTPAQGFSDAFVAKLSPDGMSLAYATYLGGSGYDSASGIAVDSRGAAYVTGHTGSADFSVVRAAQSILAGGTFDAFVAKLSRDGTTLTYGTYLGGSGGDGASGIAVDSSGAAYVVGQTQSSDFPVVRAAQSTYAGNADAFVVKLTPSGSSLASATYLGGKFFDFAFGIAVDSRRGAIVGGETELGTFPVVNAIQPTHGGGIADAFIAKLIIPVGRVCDVNGDGNIDRDDVNAIFVDRGQQATGAEDERDADGDGTITVKDGRMCVLRCAKPHCNP